jgi:hypothetical protein
MHRHVVFLHIFRPFPRPAIMSGCIQPPFSRPVP